jgi:hypothetical protein
MGLPNQPMPKHRRHSQGENIRGRGQSRAFHHRPGVAQLLPLIGCAQLVSKWAPPDVAEAWLLRPHQGVYMWTSSRSFQTLHRPSHPSC